MYRVKGIEKKRSMYIWRRFVAWFERFCIRVSFKVSVLFIVIEYSCLFKSSRRGGKKSIGLYVWVKVFCFNNTICYFFKSFGCLVFFR